MSTITLSSIALIAIIACSILFGMFFFIMLCVLALRLFPKKENLINDKSFDGILDAIDSAPKACLPDLLSYLKKLCFEKGVLESRTFIFNK